MIIPKEKLDEKEVKEGGAKSFQELKNLSKESEAYLKEQHSILKGNMQTGMNMNYRTVIFNHKPTKRP